MLPEAVGPESPPQIPAPPNWFAVVQHNFEEHLKEYVGKPNIQMLQIGAYTGDASLWLTSNVLTGEGAHLTDVDTWEGSAGEYEHEQLNWHTIWNIYRSRLEDRNVTPLRMSSNEYFQFFKPYGKFDIVYVDGDHHQNQVARDAHNAHVSLKPGGTLIFDDYEWYGHEEGENPRDAIVPFTLLHKDEYETIVINSQYWLRKL
jgi:predicted O-methyltransferase YrrM